MGDVSNATSLLLKSGGISYNVAVCAWVAAHGGTKNDLIEFQRILGPKPPKHTAAEIWDDLEEAWREVEFNR